MRRRGKYKKGFISSKLAVIVLIALSAALVSCGNGGDILPAGEGKQTVSSAATNWSSLLWAPGILNPDRVDPHDYMVAVHKPSITQWEGVDFTESPYVGWSQSGGDDILVYLFNLYEGAPQDQNTWTRTTFQSSDSPGTLTFENNSSLAYSDMSNIDGSRWYYFETDSVQEAYVNNSDSDIEYIVARTTSNHPNGANEALIVRVDGGLGQFWYAFGYQDPENQYRFIFNDGDLTVSNWVASVEITPQSNSLTLTLVGSGFGSLGATEYASMTYGLNRQYLLTLQGGTGDSVTVSNVTELRNAVSSAAQGGPSNIYMADGTYQLDDMIVVNAENLTIRSVSGNRNNVILRGQGMTGGVTHIFNVNSDGFKIYSVTLRDVSQHAIQTQIDVDNVIVSNVSFIDIGQQMFKVAYDPGNMSLTSDNGIVEYSSFVFTDGIASQYYTGGIDVHNGRNWVVRYNTFSGIRSPSDFVAEHAIHFWSDSRDTRVEGNLIINCDRGIGFGLGDRGHVGGIIRNNMIYHNSSEGFADVAIALESASGAEVYNNTIYMENSYPNAIEYRFAATAGATITNNLTNKAITQRDGASATLTTNVTNAQSGWFTAPSSGDLHLASSIASVVDSGTSVTGLDYDYDGDSRPQGSGIDIGADEYIP